MSEFVYTNPMKHRDYIAHLIHESSAINDQNKIKEEESKRSQKKEIEFSESVINITMNREKLYQRATSIVESAKVHFLATAIYKIFSESINPKLEKINNNSTVMRSLISTFINEEGADNILNKMKYKSIFLSDIANMVNEAVKEVKESIDINDPDTLSISQDIRDNFYDNLNDFDVNDVTEAISDRIAASIDDFSDKCSEDKELIKDIVDDAKEKMAAVNPDSESAEDIKESFDIMAKSKITAVRNRPKTIFECFVHGVANSAYKDETMRKEFVKGGRLNMDLVMERACIMYSFLEVLNTTKLANVNEEYIANVIRDLEE